MDPVATDYKIVVVPDTGTTTTMYTFPTGVHGNHALPLVVCCLATMLCHL